MKIIGYCPMTKKMGKVVFVTEKSNSDKVIGSSCDRLFLYDDLSGKINENCIGKDIEVVYGRGYNGNAFVSDVIIR